MNDPSNLAVEIRRLRETINDLSDAINRGEKVANKIAKERQRLEFALQAQNKTNVPLSILGSAPKIPAELRKSKNLLDGLRTAVAVQWCVTIDQLYSDTRKPEIATPRFAFCHIAHKRLLYTALEVALAINYRDHTTALHACKRANELLATDENFKLNYGAVWTAIQANQTPTSLQQH